MKLSINTLIYLEEAYDRALERLAAQGYKAIELFGDTPTIDYSCATAHDIATICSLRDRYGLELSMHGPCWDLNPASANRGHRDDVVVRFLEGVRLAAAIGADTMVVHSGLLSDSKLSRADALRYAADTIARCVPEAERLGVTLAVENVGYGATCMLRDVSDWTGLAEAIGSPAVGLALDVGHATLQGFDLLAAIRAAGPRLKHLHLHSNSGRSDDHWRFDEGVVDFRPVVQGLKEIGFTGCASVEIYAPTRREEALEASVRLFERLWNEA